MQVVVVWIQVLLMTFFYLSIFDCCKKKAFYIMKTCHIGGLGKVCVDSNFTTQTNMIKLAKIAVHLKFSVSY